MRHPDVFWDLLDVGVDELPGDPEAFRDARQRDAGPLEVAPQEDRGANLVFDVRRPIRPGRFYRDSVLVYPTHLSASPYNACLSTITKRYCVQAFVETLISRSKSFTVNHLCVSLQKSEVSTSS